MLHSLHRSEKSQSNDKVKSTKVLQKNILRLTSKLMNAYSHQLINNLMAVEYNYMNQNKDRML